MTEPVVPDALLAAAKDNRYIRNLSSLLSQVISPHVSTRGAGEATASLQPEISLLARIFHAWIVLNEGKSLGLEHSGLSYRSHSLRIRIFTLLYTLSPYLIQRAGRNGWGDMRNIQSSLSVSWQPTGNQAVEREQLRGEERRRLHEDMKRRMLERALDNNNTQSDGIESQTQAIQPTTLNESNRTHSIDTRRRKFAVVLYRKMRALVWKILGQLSAASEMNSPTPHVLPISNSNENNGHSLDSSANIDRLAGLFKWLIRLNLALFYTNGKYPSMLNRITGLRIDRVQSDVKIVAERPEYNAIGLMIIGQAFAKLVQALAEISLNTWYARKRRLADKHPQPTSNSIEAKVPSAVSRNEQMVETTSKEVNCGICMNPRQHSAAPTSCGHVFCWNCIQHWIATVRPECPLCRTPTRPQDVIVLNNYSP